jgi:predicted RNA binding protein YcfA (HicA-like mRNA interferase family)
MTFPKPVSMEFEGHRVGEKIPVVRSNQLLKALESVGFREVNRTGSHVKLRRGSQIAIVPDHGSKDVPLGTLRSVLKQAGLSIEEFRELL